MDLTSLREVGSCIRISPMFGLDIILIFYEVGIGWKTADGAAGCFRRLPLYTAYQHPGRLLYVHTYIQYSYPRLCAKPKIFPPVFFCGVAPGGPRTALSLSA